MSAADARKAARDIARENPDPEVRRQLATKVIESLGPEGWVSLLQMLLWSYTGHYI